MNSNGRLSSLNQRTHHIIRKIKMHLNSFGGQKKNTAQLDDHKSTL